MLIQYMQRVQRALGDTVFERFNPYDLIAYINEARGIVAAEGECVRVLCPSTAGVSSVVINASGNGYTSLPTISFSTPPTGITATGIAEINASHQLIGIALSNPGSGYTTPPTITITGGGGSGATATAVLNQFAQCVVGQEVYNHADFSPLIASAGSGLNPGPSGASAIIAIRTIAISWGSMKPTLRFMEWGDFQSYLRSYNVAAQSYPRVWSPFARGTSGSFYLWPIPSVTAQMDMDCICLPQDLTNDQTLEAIPYPWTNAVPYKAAELACFGELDLRPMIERYRAHYTARMQFAAATSALGARVPDYYASAAGL